MKIKENFRRKSLFSIFLQHMKASLTSSHKLQIHEWFRNNLDYLSGKKFFEKYYFFQRSKKKNSLYTQLQNSGLFQCTTSKQLSSLKKVPMHE